MISHPSQPHPIRVLLVEDEAVISEWVKDSLTDDGFDVHAVATARAALDYLNRGADVDVMVTDINLPGDMDGSKLAMVARDLRPDLAVVYASGRMQPSDLRSRVPGSIFISKPYLPSQMSTLLTRIADQPADRSH